MEICNFFNTPGARFTYTLLCDCSFTPRARLRAHQTFGARFVMTTMDKVTQQISIKILAHLVNKNLLQMCFRYKICIFCTVFKSKLTCDICDFMSHQKPASITFVTKYVTFMLDFRVIYVAHVTYLIIYVTGVTYMICCKYDPTYLIMC